MQRQTLHAKYLQTIDWFENIIVDWASAGTVYCLDGQVKQTQKYHFGFGDSSITSSDGLYVFLSQKLGTKGLLLKNGKILREINRSYYCADVYEYPAAYKAGNGFTPFVEKAYNTVVAHPEIMPPVFDIEEFKRDYLLSKDLVPIVNQIDQLADSLQSTQIAVNSDAAVIIRTLNLWKSMQR